MTPLRRRLIEDMTVRNVSFRQTCEDLLRERGKDAWSTRNRPCLWLARLSIVVYPKSGSSSRQIREGAATKSTKGNAFCFFVLFVPFVAIFFFDGNFDVRAPSQFQLPRTLPDG